MRGPAEGGYTETLEHWRCGWVEVDINCAPRAAAVLAVVDDLCARDTHERRNHASLPRSGGCRENGGLASLLACHHHGHQMLLVWLEGFSW